MVKMFHMSTAQTSCFKSAISAIGETINECNICFRPDGVHIICNDSMKTSIFDLDLPAENFDGYKCVDECKVGVNMKYLSHLLKFVDNNSVINLSMDSETPNTLDIDYYPDGLDHDPCHVEYSAIDIDYDEFEFPKSDFDSKENFDYVIAVPSAYLQSICKKMKTLEVKNIKIIQNGEKFIISSGGDNAPSTQQIVKYCVYSAPPEDSGSNEEAENTDEIRQSDKRGRPKKKEAETADDDASVVEGEAESDDEELLKAVTAKKRAPRKTTKGSDEIKIETCAESSRVYEGTFNLARFLSYIKCTSLNPITRLGLKSKSALYLMYAVGTLGTLTIAVSTAKTDGDIDTSQN